MQARIRGSLIMALSNQFGGFVLSTGNKSEIAVGYCTLYGDMVGALSPIGDLYKHEVYDVSAFLNKDHPTIPTQVYSRPPSAELRKDQKDQDSLPPYETLDAILKMLIEKNSSYQQICSQGFDSSLVKEIFDKYHQAEFKRFQAAPILKLSRKSFGSGRLFPLARQSYED
ncbi:MAG: NAD(+) synthase [Bdellovibrionota bacterium]